MGFILCSTFPRTQVLLHAYVEVPCESRNAGAVPTATGGSQCQPGVAVTGRLA